MEENVNPIMIFPLTPNPMRLSTTLLSSFLSLDSLCGRWGKANPGPIREDSRDETEEERETEREKETERERDIKRKTESFLLVAGKKEKKFNHLRQSRRHLLDSQLDNAVNEYVCTGELQFKHFYK